MPILLETEDDAWRFLNELLDRPDAEIDPREIQLGAWSKVTVDLEEIPQESAIFTPWLEAFLNIQRNVYRSAALAKYGSADTKKLTELDLEEFEIPFIVTGGSSHYLAEFQDKAEKLAALAISKMTGRQIAIVLLGAALLWGGTTAFGYYTEAQKQIRIAEVNSEEKKRFLESMDFITTQQAANYNRLVTALTETDIGKKVVTTSQDMQEGMLKAASRTKEATIQGKTLTAGDAQELRATTRQKATIKIVTQELRVTDANTEDALITSVEFTDPETGDQFRASFQDALLVEGSADVLHAALKDRGTVWVEMQIREVRGEVRSVEIRKATREPPQEARAAN